MNYQYGSEENLRKIVNALAVEDVALELYFKARHGDEFSEALDSHYVFRDSKTDSRVVPELNKDLKSRLASLVEGAKQFGKLCEKERILPGLHLECNPRGWNYSTVGKLAILNDPILRAISRTVGLEDEIYDFVENMEEFDKGLNSDFLVMSGYRPFYLILKNKDAFQEISNNCAISAKKVMNDRTKDYQLTGSSFTISPRSWDTDHYYTSSSDSGSFRTHLGKILYHGPMRDDEVKHLLDDVISGNFQTKLEKTS